MKKILSDKTRIKPALIKVFGATVIVLLILVSIVGVVSANSVALVYKGPAACPKCTVAVANLLETYPNQNFTVMYVGPYGDMSVQQGLEYAKTHPEVVLYAQPGGDGSVSKAFNNLKADAPAVRDFVANGGLYLGSCMGAYLVDNDPGFDLGLNTFQYIKTSGATVRNTRSTFIQVMWKGTPRWIYFQDGSYFVPDNDADKVILARYMNGPVAAMVQSYGSGKIGVSGPHLEADPDTWNARSGYDRDVLSDDRDLGYELIDELMK